MIIFGQAAAGLILASSILTNTLLVPQFATVNDIPEDYFQEHRLIYGKVERVIDGDTIRVRHCPSLITGCPEPDKKKKLSDSTLSIRIYGIDSPELQKKKADPPSQPFAQDAKDFTSSLILNKPVAVTLLHKDQYNRAIGKVKTVYQEDVSLELLQRGLAFLYSGQGAEYDGQRAIFEAKQAEAKNRKIGVWSQGDNVMTPGEFKRQEKELKRQAVVVSPL